MDILVKRVLGTIDKFNMIREEQTVVAAVSGGYDSLCMLYVLKELKAVRKFDICVAHINHSFRDTADDDENFVKDIAGQLGFKAYTLKADVKGYSDERKISFETAGREIRYDFLNKVADKFESSVIATAHNANDSIESFMMHLMRGSGLGGLTGIKPVRQNIIRPLIEIERKQIEHYCDKNKIMPQIDVTNLSDDYTRNDIRHNVIPNILDRSGTDTFIRTMQILTADEEFMHEYTLNIADKYIFYGKNYAQIDVKDFNRLPLAIKRRLLRLVMSTADIEAGLVHIDACIDMAQKNYGGKCVVMPNGLKAKLNKGILKIEEVQRNDK